MISFESPQLPADQVHALNTMNVTVYGGTHGTMVEIEPYGMACLGVVDDSYEAMAAIATDLDSARDDVLAHEAFWRDPNLDDEWYVGRIQEVARQSLLIDAEPFSLGSFASQARDGQVCSPHDYAICLAKAKGVRTEFADATEDDRQEWLRRRAEAGAQYPAGMYESAAYRDTKMVERLGAIAVTMDPGRRWRRPSLDMIVGGEHVAGIKEHMRANGVRIKTRRYTPKPTKHDHEAFLHSLDEPAGTAEREWSARADQLLQS